MKKETEDGVIYREPYFNSKAKTVTHPDMINNLIMEAEEEICNKIADWLSKGSNWVIELILDHYLNIIGYTPLRGSSYLPLPKELRNPMKGLINLQNEDEKCFSPWARTLKRAIWYQNEGQILTPIFNNFDSSWLFWCMITMPNE